MLATRLGKHIQDQGSRRMMNVRKILDTTLKGTYTSELNLKSLPIQATH